MYMSHVDQFERQSLRHMNNGTQGKSRNDRFHVAQHQLHSPAPSPFRTPFFFISLY